jgi:predicted RNase H-like HicB family nuclease
MINLPISRMVAPLVCVVFLTGPRPEYVITSTGGGPEEMVEFARAHEAFFAYQNAVIIDSLPGTTHRLVKPITARISYKDDEFLAEFPEAEMVTSGDTSEEAIEWLKDTIVNLYELYDNERAALGPFPRRQLAVLETYIGEKQPTEA